MKGEKRCISIVSPLSHFFKKKKTIYLKVSVYERESKKEKDLLYTVSLPWSGPKPGTPSRSHTRIEETQALGSSAAASPGTLTGSWIRSRGAETLAFCYKWDVALQAVA